MKLKELIESRYSVRAYHSLQVEKEKVDYILECARLAPSACNLQPWKFYVLTSKVIIERMQASYDRQWFKTAPMYIIVCKDSDIAWKRSKFDNKDFGDVDAAISAEHICLAASEVGLGTCWVCNFDPQILKDALDLSDNVEPIAIFPLGYIDIDKSSLPEEKNRKPLSEITEWI